MNVDGSWNRTDFALLGSDIVWFYNIKRYSGRYGV